MKIKDDAEGRIGLTSVLAGNYTRITDDQINELWRLLGNCEVDDVAQALDAHILSEEGRFSPQAGQLLEQIRRTELKSRTNPMERDPFKGRSKKGRQKAPMPDKYQDPEGRKHLLVWPVDCQECGDTGIARFYHDDRKRVWLASEALELPQAMFDRLKRATAVCDCDEGRGRSERMLSTEHKGRTMAVYPRLEHIRQMSSHRRDEQMREVAV